MTVKYAIEAPPGVKWQQICGELMALLDSIEIWAEEDSEIWKTAGQRFDIVKNHGMRLVRLPDSPSQ